MNASLRRILIVQPYGIGDLLFLTPVLRALRLIPTVEQVDLLLGSRTEEIVKHNPHADEIFKINKDLFHQRNFFQNLNEILELGKKLRKKNYDLLLDYSLRGEYAFLSQFFLNIRRRAGFDYKKRGFFHNIRLPLPEGFKGKHVADYVCALAEKAGVRVEDRYLEFYLSALEREDTGRLIKEKTGELINRFMVVSPGGGESWGKDAHFKQWPVRFFAECIERLSRKEGIERILILGSSSERVLGDELARQVKVPAVNLSGETSLNQTAALIEKAELFIGNDGGLVHLAHALRVPVIAFYGPVDPDVYGPYPVSGNAIAVFKEGLECRPCYQKFRYNSACATRECLQDLLPEAVWDFLKSRNFLNRKKHEPAT